MCAQCATTGVVAAAATATGLRAWLGAHSPAWWTPGVRRWLGTAVVVAGVLAAGLLA